MAQNKRWLIDADDLLHEFWLLPGHTRKTEMDLIRCAPAVEAEEVVYGQWEDKYNGAFANPRFRCSVCKEEALYRSERDFLGTWSNVQVLTPRCPFCGAKLNGGNTGE